MVLLLKVIRRTNIQHKLTGLPPLSEPLRPIGIDDRQRWEIRAGDVKPGEASRVYEIKEGYVVNHAQGMTMHELNGSVTHIHLDGLMETTKPCLQRIDICDLREVTDHRVHRMPHTDVAKVMSHVIHFVGGGFFSFLMDDDGKILEMIERSVITTIDRVNGVLTLHGSRMPDNLPRRP